MSHTPRSSADAEHAALRAENARLRRRLDRTEARERERQGRHLDRLERVAEAARLAVFDWIDTGADEIYFTPAAYSVLGHEAYSFVPSWTALLAGVHPADRPGFDREVRRVIYEASALSTEVRIARADGTYHHIEFSAVATASVDGEVTRLTGALRDIEEAHRMRGEIAHLHERLALVIRGTRAGVWDWLDMSTDEVVWSDELLRLLGYDAPDFEMSMAVFWGLIHAEDVPLVEAAIAESRETGADFRVEYRLRFRGRGYRWVRSAGALVTDAAGVPRRLTGAIVDIHEERELRACLTEATERLDLALSAASAGVWDWRDIGEEAVLFSPGMLSLLGYAAEEVEHTVAGFWALIHEDDHKRVQAALERTLAEATRFDVAYRIRFRDSGYRWVRSTGTPVLGEDGQPTRLTGSIADVHEAEAHRLQLQAAAERYARLSAIAQDQLLEPIRHVEAFCELIEEEGLSAPDARAYLTTLRTSARRAMRVAADMVKV